MVEADSNYNGKPHLALAVLISCSFSCVRDANVRNLIGRNMAVPAGCLSCAWCRKVGPAKQFAFKTSTPRGSKAFCSEVCFTQCRRASFKRNKTCDWCRHVRHTVNYVDFQDGDHQLQFCSDKCLNQYKMNIFCKETQAHLQLHPHPAGTSTAVANSGAVGSSGGGAGVPNSTLITPELWMRDCRSESPDSTKSRSPERIPSPIIEITTPTKVSPPSSPSPEKDLKPTNLTVSPKSALVTTPQKTSRKENGFKSRRIVRNKRSLRVSAPIVTPQVEVNTNSSSPRSTNSGSPPKNPPPPLIPPLPPYPLPPNPMLPPDHPLHRPPFLNPGFFPPPHVLAEFAARFPMPRHPIRKPTPTNNLPPLLPLNRSFPPPLNFPGPPQPPPPLPQSLLPPPTLMVPYPVLVPIPIPIPILIPIPPDFKLKEEKSPTDEDSTTSSAAAPNIKQEPESPPSQSPPLSTPPRKRKRPDLSSEDDIIRKQKFVPA
ncbi:hypothetical protein J6590_030364 [Homalodisca vitripennis]|nr:hypothetical protein J6590_030364 [Homalodisca vitripennis]